MRAVLSIFMILIAVPALAQTPVTPEMASKFHANCINQEAPLLSAKAKELMCSCVAAQIIKTMTVEDVQAMGSQGPDARPAVNKMLLNVYAPCIEFPAYDYHYYSCIQSPDTAKLGSDPKKLCTCLASEVADFLDKNAQNVFSDILARNPNVVDPMSALTEDQEFQSFAQTQLLACVGGR